MMSLGSENSRSQEKEEEKKVDEGDNELAGRWVTTGVRAGGVVLRHISFGPVIIGPHRDIVQRFKRYDTHNP